MISHDLHNQLNDLRLNFEQAIIDGNVFADVKNIYLQMKEVKIKIYGERQVNETDPLERLSSDFKSGSSDDDLFNELA